MVNGLVIGFSALAGVWLGWYALPICLSVLVVIKLLEQDHRYGVLLTCLAFVTIGALRATEPPTVTTNTDLPLSTGAIGTITSFPIPSGDGHRAVLSVTELCVADQCIPSETKVLVYVRAQDPPLSRGQTLRVDWRLDTLQELPTGYRGYVASQGAESSARVSNVQLLEDGSLPLQWVARANTRVAANMEALLPGDTGALGTGIVTGDDSGLSPETEENFRATGTTHITAVSGQNVSLIIGFLSFWYVPKTIRFRIAFHVLLIAAVWSFTVFVGMESPAMRAAIVATLTVLGNHVGRKSDPVTLLGLTLGAIALWQPLVVHSVGFWLSGVASLALCVALPRKLEGSFRKVASELTAAPGVASVATMPISMMAFGVWSPIGIIANMLISPVMTLAFPISYAFSALAAVAPGFAQHFSWVPAIPLDFALVIVDRLAPVATELRVDTFTPILLLVLWTPIVAGIWLFSSESHRWIHRVLTYYRPSARETS